jgi:hypothetical protein
LEFFNTLTARKQGGLMDSNKNATQNRRNFLKSAGIVSAAAMVWPVSLSQTEAKSSDEVISKCSSAPPTRIKSQKIMSMDNHTSRLLDSDGRDRRPSESNRAPGDILYPPLESRNNSEFKQNIKDISEGSCGNGQGEKLFGVQSMGKTGKHFKI